MLCDYCGNVVCLLTICSLIIRSYGLIIVVFDYLTFTVLLWLHKQIIVLDTSGKII